MRRLIFDQAPLSDIKLRSLQLTSSEITSGMLTTGKDLGFRARVTRRASFVAGGVFTNSFCKLPCRPQRRNLSVLCHPSKAHIYQQIRGNLLGSTAASTDVNEVPGCQD